MWGGLGTSRPRGGLNDVEKTLSKKLDTGGDFSSLSPLRRGRMAASSPLMSGNRVAENVRGLVVDAVANRDPSSDSHREAIIRNCLKGLFHDKKEINLKQAKITHMS